MAETIPPGDRFDWGEMVEDAAEIDVVRARQPKPSNWLLDAGKWLLVGCVSSLVVGNVVVRLFFPELVGTGLKPESLAILIPIWTLGAAGLIFLAAGYLLRLRTARRKHDADHG